MEESSRRRLVRLTPEEPIWTRVFTVAPLVLIGTLEPDGTHNLAPKHMVSPLGWGPYFGFVCTPRHATYHNARREGVFTVSYPRPSQVLLTSLAAAPRCEEGTKPELQALPTFPAQEVEGVLFEDAYFYLECRVHHVYDDFGEESLVTGQVVAAYVDAASLRTQDQDDHDLIYQDALLAYLDPGRFARIETNFSFPFVSGHEV